MAQQRVCGIKLAISKSNHIPNNPPKIRIRRGEEGSSPPSQEGLSQDSLKHLKGQARSNGTSREVSWPR